MAERPPLWVYAEAGATMIVASAAIRAIPFRHIARRMRPRAGSRPATKAQIVDVRRAIRAWASRLPWRTMCFEEGLTAHWMLRRRGLSSHLHYGAATIDGRLKAHVWVRSGEGEVVGCDVAGDYALLATFPAE